MQGQVNSGFNPQTNVKKMNLEDAVILEKKLSLILTVSLFDLIDSV